MTTDWHKQRPVTPMERVEWAKIRVQEAENRVIRYPNDSVLRVALQSRRRELEDLQRVCA